MVFAALTFSQRAHVLMIRNDRDSLYTTERSGYPALPRAMLPMVLVMALESLKRRQRRTASP